MLLRISLIFCLTSITAMPAAMADPSSTIASAANSLNNKEDQRAHGNRNGQWDWTDWEKVVEEYRGAREFKLRGRKSNPVDKDSSRRSARKKSYQG